MSDYVVKIAIRHGEYKEHVTSLRQAKDKQSAIKKAIEGASRQELQWIEPYKTAYDCGGEIALEFISCTEIEAEHLGVMMLYLKQ